MAQSQNMLQAPTTNKSLTRFRRILSFPAKIFMAENIPNVPAGAVPPKKETGKVQPKKETVRINLPPKPSAAPTIKLPTLPPGGPTGAASAPIAPAAPTSAAPAPAAPRASAAPVAAKPAAASAPAAQRPAASRPAPAAATVSGLDVGLAIAAMVAGLVAVGAVVYLAFLYTIPPVQ
jgi:hypothetical protein